MVQLINGLWLYGLAAVSIPLLIHLWNIRQGKILKVGSVALITAASKKSSRSFRLTELPLLIIRCLIIALVALLLTQPVWQQRQAAVQTKGWVIIPPESVSEVYRHYKPRLDSLHRAGYTLHELNAGFKTIDSVQLIKLLRSPAAAAPLRPGNYWMLLNRLNGKLPPATPVYLFTTAQLRNFSGPKPRVALNVHWQTFSPADSVHTWIQRAWLTPGDRIRVVTGTSKPQGTLYTYHTIDAEPPASSLFRVQAAEGRLAVHLKSAGGSATTVDTTIQRFAVYSDRYSSDTHYVTAALQTLTQFGQQKATIQQYTRAGQIPGGQDWLFWLSDTPAPAAVALKAKHLFSYAPGKARAISSWFNFTPEYLLADQGTAVNLYRSIPAGTADRQPVWTDGFGRPLLNLKPLRSGAQYTFYSHFNPAWGNLVWDERFPLQLAQLITPPAQINLIHDRRTLSQNQLMPGIGTSTYTGGIAGVKQTDLRPPVWALLVLLFLTERLLAHRSKSSPVHE